MKVGALPFEISYFHPVSPVQLLNWRFSVPGVRAPSRSQPFFGRSTCAVIRDQFEGPCVSVWDVVVE